MKRLLPLTTQVFAPGAILAAGLAVVIKPQADVTETIYMLVLGAIVAPAAMVAAAFGADAYWTRRQIPTGTDRMTPSEMAQSERTLARAE